MTLKISKVIFLIIFTSAFILPIFFVLSQEDNITFTENDPLGERIQLEEELRKLEEQLLKIEGDITKTESEKKTLNNQIYLLKKKIEKFDIQIQQSNTLIKDISLQIGNTEESIDQTNLKIDDSQEKLINILRQIYENDQISILEILFTENELSDFFNNLLSLQTLHSKNRDLLKQIENLKFDLENQKQALDGEKLDLESLLKMQLLQRKDSDTTKKEQEYFLKLTEAQYQTYLKEKAEAQKRAADIRARIFELIGVPEAPKFGEAVEIAKYVESITGVRPALLLAVLTQESDIGKNVGQCYLTNPKEGSGVKAISGAAVSRVMKPDRDVTHFLNICQSLGREYSNTPVSCPMQYGWGGAMGPAQFIPSTWVRYDDRVAEITQKAANPWDIKDAFLAAALYLADYGAAKKTTDAEWKAAMIYFSGSTNTKYRFYGDSVMKIALGYEDDIKAIENNSLGAGI